MLTGKNRRRRVSAMAKIIANCECDGKPRRGRSSRQRSNIDEVFGLPLPSTAPEMTPEQAQGFLLDQGIVTGNMLALPSIERPRKRKPKQRTGNKSRRRRYAEGNHDFLIANVPVSDHDVPLLELPSTIRRRR
jgi:hypothetical protein